MIHKGREVTLTVRLKLNPKLTKDNNCVLLYFAKNYI